MEGASAPGERGFTLIELVIAVGVIAVTAAVGIGMSLAGRSLAVTSAATEFDQFLDSARTMARDLNGAVLAFEPDAYGDGTEVRLLARDQSGTFVPTNVPPLHARAIIEETQSLGAPPFGFVVHVNGALGGQPGFRVGSAVSAEVGCPASGAFHFLFHTANASAERFVPCRVALATTGPVSVSSWQPEPTAPPPTPCSGPGCTPPTLPSPPSSNPVCPPNFTPIPGGCAPAPSPTPNPAANYHITTTGAAAALGVGTTGTFVAQSTLTNASVAAPGTPTTIPVFVAQTTPGICAVTPSGDQPSGATFTITALLAGTCSITIQGDTTGVIGSTADTATITVAISAAPTPTPSPQTCDLVQNGQCFHQIVPQTAVQFWKYVVPEIKCNGPQEVEVCSYEDSISKILLYDPYIFQPPLPPYDEGHELLFRIIAIAGVATECLPYSSFQFLAGSNPIDWNGTSAGAPSNPPVGYGEPTTYASLNYVQVVSSLTQPPFDDTSRPWTQGTTLAALYAANVSRQIGPAYLFTFTSVSATSGSSIEWFPDFAGCDAATPNPTDAHQYGISGIQLLFEIYQADPS